jgi:hypothetical protein
MGLEPFVNAENFILRQINHLNRVNVVASIHHTRTFLRFNKLDVRSNLELGPCAHRAIVHVDLMVPVLNYGVAGGHPLD